MNPGILTEPSAIEGFGQFAAEPIRAGEVVVVWSGAIAADEELRRIRASGRYHSSVAIGEGANILFGIFDPSAQDEDSHAVPEGSGVGRMNHSCDSNLWLLDAVTLVARRDIAAGEALTIDYSLSCGDPSWSMDWCTCGSPVCRAGTRGGQSALTCG
jgi:uncharacterized protein